MSDTVKVPCVCSRLTSVEGEMTRLGRPGCVKCAGDGFALKWACRACKGTGKVGGKCPDCRGAGWRDMDNVEI